MKQLTFKFFEPVQKTVNPKIKGFISVSGKITLPKDFGSSVFDKLNHCRIAMDETANKIKSLYLFPVKDSNQFEVRENKKNYSIDFAGILDEQGFEYQTAKTPFVVAPMVHDGETVYELKIIAPKPRKALTEPKEYTGKKRGRKPKQPEKGFFEQI